MADGGTPVEGRDCCESGPQFPPQRKQTVAVAAAQTVPLKQSLTQREEKQKKRVIRLIHAGYGGFNFFPPVRNVQDSLRHFNMLYNNELKHFHYLFIHFNI